MSDAMLLIPHYFCPEWFVIIYQGVCFHLLLLWCFASGWVCIFFIQVQGQTPHTGLTHTFDLVKQNRRPLFFLLLFCSFGFEQGLWQ